MQKNGLNNLKRNNMKQTAVEWLIEQFEKNGYIGLQAEKQALQMEKQQIIDAHDNGYIDGANKKNTTAEQYYNETYKK